MEPPSNHTRKPIKFALGSTKVADGLRVQVRENQRPKAISGPQCRQRLIRKVDDMLLCILRSDFGDRPYPLLEIQLIPCEPRDFFATLPGECQEFDDSPIRTADLPRR